MPSNPKHVLPPLAAAAKKVERRRRLAEIQQELRPDPNSHPPSWVEAILLTFSVYGRSFVADIGLGVPSSWEALTHPEMDKVEALMVDTGLCLTMTPPAAVLKRLLREDEATRLETLIEYEGQLLQDLDREVQSLRRLASPPLGKYIGGAVEALEAHRGGLYGASQALSAAVIGSLFDGASPVSNRGMNSTRHALREAATCGAGGRRFAATLRAAARALDGPGERGGRPGFNRHATVHDYGEATVTQANSLGAVMLVAGVLFEVDWLLKQTEQRGSRRE